LSKDMAEHRKFFRPRRLAFDGRLFPRASIFAGSLALCAALLPAYAQEAGLRNGAASLAAGKYDAAVRQLSATINSDDASRTDAAQALYLRGIAYRKMGEPARAAADLGAAIWLGLSEADKVKAMVNRGLAYQAAGLGKEGAAEIASARKLGGSRAVDDLIAEGGGAPAGTAAIAAFSTEVRPEDQGASSGQVGAEAPTASSDAAPATRTANASPGAWSTSVADQSRPAQSSGGGNRLTRWFGSLTDSSTPQAAPQPAPAPAAAPPPAPAAQPARPAPQPSAATASSSWSTTTEVQEASAGPSAGEGSSRWSRLFNRTAEANPQAQPAAAPASGGAYKLQLATSRSEAEAQALWMQVSRTQSVSGVQPEIERVEIGSFGTFYALRIGPFPDKAESLKVCNALKRSGIDCSPATP